MIRRIRRGCYDKFHRCPGWAGGGFRYPKNPVCENGSLSIYGGGTLDYEDPLWKVKFHKCSKRCGTLVLPFVIRYVDPNWLFHRAKRAIKDWRYDRDRR